MPHKTKGEGFFIAGLSPNPKKAGGYQQQIFRRQQSPSLVERGRGRGFESLNNPDEFAFFSENNISRALPAIHWEDYLCLKKHLKIISAGITLGETKGKDFIPSIALALSNRLSPAAFPSWETDKETALKYLRKETSFLLPANLPQGYLLIKYQGQALGFIKNIGNRFNNLYPQEWRIRSK
jgi:NOL1/NOP2/fmu family ribosome biogenesis protein